MNDISRGILAKNRLFEDLVLCGWARAKLMQFADELSHEDRYSLDAFLETHPDFLKLGKEAIAQALILCEADSNIAARRKDGWYRYFFDKTLQGAPRGVSPRDAFLLNRFSIVTFNFDRSFERALYLFLART